MKQLYKHNISNTLFNTMTTQSFFVLITISEWNKLLTDGFLSQPKKGDNNFDDWEEPMNNWMMQEMKKRLPSSAFHSDEKRNDTFYMYVDKTDIWAKHVRACNMMVIHVEVQTANLLHFDDNDYVMVLNNINNGFHDMFMARSLEEANEKKNASVEEVKASYERMFDISSKRDVEYCGALKLRGMTPYISLDMVRGIVSL